MKLWQLALAGAFAGSLFSVDAVNHTAAGSGSLWQHALVKSDDQHPGNALKKIYMMLDRLKQRIGKETEREKKITAELMIWCNHTQEANMREIAHYKELAEAADADLFQTTAIIKALQEKINEITTELITTQTQLRLATERREREKADYEKGRSDLQASINAIVEAMRLLEVELKKNHDAVNLNQVQTKKITTLLQTIGVMIDAAAFESSDKQQLASLIQADQKAKEKESEDDMGASALFSGGKAPVYKARSQDIFDLLEGMKKKALKDQFQMELDDQTSEQQYRSQKYLLEEQIGALEVKLKRQNQLKSEAVQVHSERESDYNAAMSDLKHNQELLAKNKEDCTTWAEDHQKLLEENAEEVAAIDMAKDEIAKAYGAIGGEKKFDFVQANKSDSLSLLQVSDKLSEQLSEEQRNSLVRAKTKVVSLIRNLAKENRDMALAALASRVKVSFHMKAGGRDPFAKVKDLISNMIESLDNRIESMTTFKMHCDEQMKEVKDNLKNMGVDIDKLDRMYETALTKDVGYLDMWKMTQDALDNEAYDSSHENDLYTDMERVYALNREQLEDGLSSVNAAIAALVKIYGEPDGIVTIQPVPEPPVVSSAHPLPAEPEPLEEQPAEETGASFLQESQTSSKTNSAAALLQQFQDQMENAADDSTRKTMAGQGIIEMLYLVRDDMAKSLAILDEQWQGEKINHAKVMEGFLLLHAAMQHDLITWHGKYLAFEKLATHYHLLAIARMNEKERASTWYFMLKNKCEADLGNYAEKKAKRDKEIAGLKEALDILDYETVNFFQTQTRYRGTLRGFNSKRLDID